MSDQTDRKLSDRSVRTITRGVLAAVLVIALAATAIYLGDPDVLKSGAPIVGDLVDDEAPADGGGE